MHCFIYIINDNIYFQTNLSSNDSPKYKLFIYLSYLIYYQVNYVSPGKCLYINWIIENRYTLLYQRIYVTNIDNLNIK